MQSRDAGPRAQAWISRWTMRVIIDRPVREVNKGPGSWPRISSQSLSATTAGGAGRTAVRGLLPEEQGTEDDAAE